MDLTFESNTIQHLGNLWAAVNFLEILLWLCVFLVIVYITIEFFKWVTGGAKSRLELIKAEKSIDSEMWGKAIDDRVNMLNELKRREIKVREEINGLYNVKEEVDTTNCLIRDKK